MKYEEDVEEGGERWSKPHVASLSLHSLFELRSTILNGALLLDVNAYTIAQVVGEYIPFRPMSGTFCFVEGIMLFLP